MSYVVCGNQNLEYPQKKSVCLSPNMLSLRSIQIRQLHTGHPKEMVRVLLRAVQRPSSNQQRQLSHPSRRSESRGEIAQEGEVSRRGADNVPAELVQAWGEAMISALLTNCSKLWQTGEWLTPWTQSLIITLPKKGNL